MLETSLGRSHMERALGIFEAACGAAHPETATSLDHLAIILHHQGDLDGARSLHGRALTIRKAALGPITPTLREARSSLRRWIENWRSASSRLTLYGARRHVVSAVVRTVDVSLSRFRRTLLPS